MKKLVYFIPAAAAFIFYGAAGMLAGFGAIHPVAWILVALLFAAAVIMAKGKWWGCFFGVAAGVILIFMGMRDTGQIVKEWPIGLILCIGCLAFGWGCRGE